MIKNKKESAVKTVKTLIFDIETMANLAYVWGKYEQNVIRYEKEWYMLSFAYKWLGEKQTYVASLPDFESYKKDKTDDRELVKLLHSLFDAADIIIAHNGASFDVKKSNAKFIEHGLPPPSYYKVIDTKLVAKRYFNFNSNKLDDLGNILGLGRKVETGGFDLWMGCASGDMKSWKKMCIYNKQDVVLLEKIYLKMRGWMSTHPNVGIFEHDIFWCPKCGSKNVQRRGEYRGNPTVYAKYFCNDCRGWSRNRLKVDIPAPSLKSC